MERNKSIKINALINGIRTVLNLIFPLITFPYISRVLSIDEIGKYNFSNSIISYFLLIAALGFDKYAVREGAKYRDNKDRMGEFASKVFSLNMIATVISYILLFILLLVSKKLHGYIFCLMIFSMQIFFTTLGTEWLYSIYEEYAYITIRSIVFKVISIILLFVFVKDNGDYLNYAAITVFASVGSNILNFVNAKKYCKIKLVFSFDWKKLLKPILVIFASNVAIQIFVNSDVTMLGYLQNDSVVGIYSVSTKIYSIVRTLLSAVLIVSIPRFSMYVGKNKKKEYDALFSTIVNWLFVMIVPATFGLLMLRVNVITIIAGEKYISAAPSLLILCFAIICGIYSTLFNQCVLLPYKREKYSLISSVISAVLNIGLNFILIPYFAEIGAAFTTLVSEFTVAVINYISCRDIVKPILKNEVCKKNVLSVLIGTASIIIFCKLGTLCITNMWIETLICIIGSIISYVFILLLLKNPMVYSILKKYKQKYFYIINTYHNDEGRVQRHNSDSQ